MKVSGKDFKKALRGADITQEKAAELIGVSRQTINSWVKSAEMSRSSLDRIKLALQIDFTSENQPIVENDKKITNGSLIDENAFTGPMEGVSDIGKINTKLTYDENSTFPLTKELPTTNTSKKGVPYYDIDFMGGFDMVFNSQQIQPSFYIDFLPFNDCDCWINVTGKSMGPLIAHGDIVGLKQVPDWQRFLLEGEIYAVVTDNGFRTIKMLGAGPDKESYTLIPYNKSEEYKPQVIPKEVITHIFRVKGNIKKFF